MGKLIKIMAVLLLVGFSGVNCAYAGRMDVLSDNNAILAILGEAEGEPYLGKVALAKTMLNRGSLKGIYGFKAVTIKDGKYYRLGKKMRLLPETEVQGAKEAWAFAKRTRSEGNWKAMGWGNASDIVIFKKQSWFKKCYIVKQIGNHYFWAVKGS